MHLKAIEQPFVFPGLNARAIDFLTNQGKWFPFDPKTQSDGGIIIDEDRFTKEDPYSAITGVYVKNKALVTRTHEVTIVGMDNTELALYRYELRDNTWVCEQIDKIIAGIRPAICLVDEYGDVSFQWTEEEIEEAILFMIENGILE
jgi:hypothetical protein